MLTEGPYGIAQLTLQDVTVSSDACLASVFTPATAALSGSNEVLLLKLPDQVGCCRRKPGVDQCAVS